eukprot:Awhi_evm1s3193
MVLNDSLLSAIEVLRNRIRDEKDRIEILEQSTAFYHDMHRSSAAITNDNERNNNNIIHTEETNIPESRSGYSLSKGEASDADSKINFLNNSDSNTNINNDSGIIDNSNNDNDAIKKSNSNNNINHNTNNNKNTNNNNDKNNDNSSSNSNNVPEKHVSKFSRFSRKSRRGLEKLSGHQAANNNSKGAILEENQNKDAIGIALSNNTDSSVNNINANVPTTSIVNTPPTPSQSASSIIAGGGTDDFFMDNNNINNIHGGIEDRISEKTNECDGDSNSDDDEEEDNDGKKLTITDSRTNLREGRSKNRAQNDLEKDRDNSNNSDNGSQEDDEDRSDENVNDLEKINEAVISYYSKYIINNGPLHSVKAEINEIYSIDHDPQDCKANDDDNNYLENLNDNYDYEINTKKVSWYKKEERLLRKDNHDMEKKIRKLTQKLAKIRLSNISLHAEVNCKNVV